MEGPRIPWHKINWVLIIKVPGNSNLIFIPYVGHKEEEEHKAEKEGW